MTDKGKLVLKGFLDLPDYERKEVINEILSEGTKTFTEKRILNESLEKAQRTLGPISSNNCPCCGR